MKMNELKQSFKELIKEIRDNTRDSYADIAFKTGIKIAEFQYLSYLR